MKIANRGFRSYIFIWAVLLGLTNPALAQLGEIGINPLLLEIGARPLGMGAAFVGVGDDLNSLLYNPGALAWARGISITLKDLENITALQAYPTGYGSSLGLAVVTSKISNVPIPSATNVASSNTNVIVLSYGTKLTFLPALYKQEAFQRIGIGLNIKGLLGQTLRRTGMLDRSATGWDMDLGLLWKGSDWWSAGFSAQNFLAAKALGGGVIKWDVGEEEGIPAMMKLGGSARVIGDLGSPIFMEQRELVLGAELDFPESSATLFRFGGEFSFDKTYFLRSGIMQQHNPGGVSTNLNLGVGYRSDSWGIDLVSYREPLREENLIYVSVLHFPKEWIVVRKLDVEKPSVILESPFEQISLEDNIVTYDDKIEVSGKVKPGVEVYVNGLRAFTNEDNAFKVVVPLQLGKNLILVEARYEGEKKTWKYKVLRKIKVPVAEEKEILKKLEKATGAEKEDLLKKEQDVSQRRKKVEELVTLGVIEVTSEAEFKLEASITRGELAAWLAKAAGMRLPSVDRDLFLDVKRDHPLAPYIKIAVDWDILRPFADGTFRPETPVTREEGEKLIKFFGIKK